MYWYCVLCFLCRRSSGVWEAKLWPNIALGRHRFIPGPRVSLIPQRPQLVSVAWSALVEMVEMVTEETKLLSEALSTVKIQVQQMKRHLVCLQIRTTTLPQ